MRLYEINYKDALGKLGMTVVVAISMIDALEVFEKFLGKDYSYEAFKCECIEKYNDSILVQS